MLAYTLKPQREYAKFYFDDANRDLSTRHLEKLADSLSELYMLDLFPIVTNCDLVVNDGQHRFTAAREMLLPFYFIAGDDIRIEDIAEANRNTDPYDGKNAVSVYSKMMLREYEDLADFLTRHSWAQVGEANKWMNQNSTLSTLIEGHFVVRSPEYAEVIASAIEDFGEVAPFVRKTIYKKAIANLLLNPDYDHKEMVRKLNLYPTILKRCARLDDAFGMLNELYNRSSRGERVEFKSASSRQSLNRWDKGFAPRESSFVSPSRGVSYQKNVEVYCTDDLSRFRIHPSARPLRRFQLDQLTEFMKRRNLLKYFPIIVDRDMVVFDGQKRLQAARNLNVPMYYIVSQNISLPMFVYAGSRSKAWLDSDYLKHFCAMGNQDYTMLYDFWSRHPYIRLKSCIQMLDGGGSGRGRYVIEHKYKTGAFRCSHLSLAQRMARAVAKINRASIRGNATVQMAIWSQMENSVFDAEYLVNKLNDRSDELYPFSTIDDCLKRLETIYNYGKPESNHIRLKRNEIRWRNVRELIAS